MKTLASAALAAVALAGVFGGACAAPSSPKGPPPTCFRNRDVWSWAAPDKRTVNLRVNLHDYYQLKLTIDCGNIDWRNLSIGLQSHGSDWICSGTDVTIIAPGPIGPNRCIGTDLRKLTPEEVAALPKNAKP
jgi:hypothetical protein